MFSWLSGIEWREPYQRGERVELTPLAEEFKQVFRLTNAHRNRVRRALREWQNVVPKESRPADLVDEFYQLLDVLEVREWDLEDPLQLNRLGTLARFTGLLVDYESVRRRARPDAEVEGEQVGGQDRGRWFYKNLAIHIVNHAQGAYDGFDGEPNFGLDAVDLTTVHRAKGLEWPAVFVPSVTSSRFPSSKTGQRRDWLVPRTMFNATRYEGSDADERRLFYVALTRPRDWLSVSRHDRVNVKATAPSDYWLELSDGQIEPGKVALPEIIARSEADDEDLAITYSELAQFMTCGMEYRLRNLLGFQPRLAPELGYGKAVHHVLRTVADRTRDTGSVPDANELASILDMSFFLPTANKPAHREMKEFARRLIARYTSDHADDLYRVWETERPFELHLDGVTVSGRADVILDEEGGTPNALAILDYKTSTAGELDPYELQLQVYSAAGRREGLDVRAAFVHDLKGAARHTVDVSDQVIEEANKRVEKAAERIRDRDFRPSPGPICRSCEVRTVCPAAQI
jgi:DNA helicase-2/ATP-dependent DNA helicase PcrA